jgi:hypothetical protein
MSPRPIRLTDGLYSSLAGLLSVDLRRRDDAAAPNNLAGLGAVHGARLQHHPKGRATPLELEAGAGGPYQRFCLRVFLECRCGSGLKQCTPGDQ